ncbi:MAG TPA: hypothetical protein VFA60_01075 [Terriglobales bacterium]|nr:hypothetical protein [Terriglobales bacterium]
MSQPTPQPTPPQQTAKGQPTAEDIVAAIKASGYLIEQEVATILEKLGFHVQTNRAYQDVEESKSREIDVWAIGSV